MIKITMILLFVLLLQACPVATTPTPTPSQQPSDFYLPGILWLKLLREWVNLIIYRIAYGEKLLIFSSEII